MMPFRNSARLAALIATGALVASCDSRLPTQPGKVVDDVNRPTLRFALSAGTNGTVEQGTPLTVTVTATDDQGVALLLTSIRNAAQSVVGSDSIAVSPASKTATRTLAVPLAGLAKGDRLTIRATATDIAQNVKVDSIVVTVSDTTPPVVAVSSSRSGATLKGGDTLDVRVTASDSAGIRYAGYRLLKLTATDTVRVRSDSVIAPSAGAITTFSATLPTVVLSDTLPAGAYQIVGFALDRSGLSARLTPAVSFTLSDASKPSSVIKQPAANGRVVVGDSLFVVDSLHDNTALASVTVDAISVRGSATLGTVDTVVRYRAVTAPATGAFRAGIRDTVVQRYLRAVAPVDTLTDSLLVRSVVRDAAGNSSTSYRKIALLPALAIASSKAGKTVAAGTAVDVRLTAGDTVGVATLGYQLFRTRATDTVQVYVLGDSVAVDGRTAATSTLSLALPLNLMPGTYQLRGFSTSAARPPVVRTVAGPSFSVADSTPPVVDFVRPSADPPSVGVGESLLVQVRLRDSIGVARVALRAYSVRSRTAGVIDTIIRYAPVIVPGASATFPATHDTTVSRYLIPLTPLDSVQDSLVVEAVAVDVSGLGTRAVRRVLVTNGPRASIVAPVAGDSLTRGSPFTFTIHASGTAGIVRYGVRILRFSAWASAIPDTLSTTIDATVAPPDFTASVLIPDAATPKDSLVLVPFAIDANNRTGTGASVSIVVRAGMPPAPRVTQSIAKRLEINDSVSVSASGDRLTYVGYVLRRLDGSVLKRDSVTVPTPAASTAPNTRIPLRLDPTAQGQTFTVTGFARDSANRMGYAVPSTVLTSNSDLASAVRDTTLIVYGHTFALPRAAVASDLSVDTLRHSVYISNTTFNRLERWTASDSSFDRIGVAVGSLPWGMSIQNDGDTLLVANSGGTNISKVCINPAACGGVSEIINKRILTRNTYVFTVTETKDENGKIRLSVVGPISYSDRPQFVSQSKGGRVFYSTRPTSYAPAGTIRWLDPKLAVPDPRQIYSYATATSDAKTVAVFNSDSIKILAAPANSSISDQLIIYDHVYGQATGGSCNGVSGTICGQDSLVVAAAAKVNALGGDVRTATNLDVASLGLTDTTFVASSGNRARIAFGEGNTHGGVGRVIMVDDPDPASAEPGPFSPNVTVRDLLENASEAVFGLGLDQTGSSVAVHGLQSYFASVDNPFHLRLQGLYDTFDQGAGIVFHPDADIGNPPRSGLKSDQTRTAFVASANGSIEIVDPGYYVSRGTLAVKSGLYGPLRASKPFPEDNAGIAPGDPRYVVLKLFGLTSQGLVVINLRARDIKDAP